MSDKIPTLKKNLKKNWLLILLVILIFILFLHKYIFPMTSFYPRNGSRAQVTLYSNPTYYNAVLPWLSFNKKQKKIHLNHKIWLNVNKLQFKIRHNQGEFWITSLESAAQAWQHGADLKILMVMGWRKWNILSSCPKDTLFLDNERIIYYPQHNTSAHNVLKEYLNKTNANIQVQAMELPRIIHKFQNKQIDAAMLQTPICAYLQLEHPDLQTNLPIEHLYSEQLKKTIRFPWIVLAVRNTWAEENRPLVDYIQQKLKREAYILNVLPPQDISRLWTSFYQSDLSAEVLEKLVSQEKLQCTSAEEAEKQIRMLLEITCPFIKYDSSLIWKQTGQPKF